MSLVHDGEWEADQQLRRANVLLGNLARIGNVGDAQAFARTCTESLAWYSQADAVAVLRADHSYPQHMELLSLWSDGRHSDGGMDQGVFDLRDLFEQDTAMAPRHALRSFPACALLRALRANGLYALQLRDPAGLPIGALLLIGRGTLHLDQEDRANVGIVADRLAQVLAAASGNEPMRVPPALVSAELASVYRAIEVEIGSRVRRLRGFSEALTAELGDSDQSSSHYAQRIAAAGKELAQVLDSLTQLHEAGSRTLQSSEFDLTRLGQELVEDIRAHAPQSRAVKVRVQAGMRARADKVLLSRVLRALLENAFELSLEGEEPVIEVGMAQGPGYRRFYVTESGATVTPRCAQTLFELFGPLQSEVCGRAGREGRTLGLAMARRIVERHGGRIWADQSESGGANFQFTLPDAAAGTAPAATARYGDSKASQRS